MKNIVYHGSQRKNLKPSNSRCLFFAFDKETAQEYSTRQILGGFKKNMKAYIYTAEVEYKNPLKLSQLTMKYKDEDIAIEEFYDIVGGEEQWKLYDYDAYIDDTCNYLIIPPTNKNIKFVDCKINEELNDNFWKWFGDSVTIDENGNPLIFYHGTRRKFDTFKAKYDDKLLFFAYDKEFAKEWADSDNRLTSDEITDRYDKTHPFNNALYNKITKKQGSDDWYQDSDVYNKFEKTKEWYKNRVEKQMGIDAKIMPVYIKAHNIFVPQRDYELVLDKIAEYYEWDFNFLTTIDDKIKEATEKFNQVNGEFKNWIENNPNANDEEYDKRQAELDKAFKPLNILNRQKAYIESDLNRIKQGAWVYFEHKVVIDKIWQLGFDAIQLSESNGIPTTLAVREGTNQIKSVENRGNWSRTSNNIFEQLNKILENYIDE